jgi:hypothetical protein
MAAPLEIAELVERFEGNLDDYRSGRYKETQLRLEFIDPFFEALGWDVRRLTVRQREVETADRQIDQQVYELYGLTQQEIRIVEQQTGRP